MRVIVLGGTRFIGRALVEDLARASHEVLVVHRGHSEPEDLPPVEHLHADRAALRAQRDALASFGADAVIDMLAMSRADARATVESIPDGARLVMVSSADVYRAFGAVLAGDVTDAVPVDELAPLRSERYPFRGQMPGAEDYEKIDVEEEALARGAVVCRLPMVYGEFDGQRREEPILRRIRAGRREIPFGPGTWLTSRGYVRDVARALRLVAESDLTGEVFNIAERATWTVRQWAREIIAAADSDAELVTVPDDALPEDLGVSQPIPQPLVIDSSKARARLGWTETDPYEALRQSVEWHLAHPPADDGSFEEDDRALSMRQ